MRKVAFKLGRPGRSSMVISQGAHMASKRNPILRIATATALVLSSVTVSVGGASTAYAAAPSFVVPVPIASPATPDQAFFNMRLQYFLPETEPLIKQTFGSALKFDDAASWEYSSYYSRAVSFATNLPTLAKIEYGPTTAYGQSTNQTESYFYQHLFYLTGLQPGQTYHYRIDTMGSDGAVLMSADKVFTTPALASNVIRIPQDMPGGAPYRLTTANAKYLLTTDLTVPNGGFVVDASGIELDLGGHTVTYDNAVNPIINETNATRAALMYSKDATFGVRTGLWNLTGQKIVNGRLVQGSHGGAGINGTGYNPVYGGATSQLEVAGITADYYGDNINGIDIGMGNNSIHHNVVYDRGTGIDLRDIQMRAITTYEPDATTVTAYNSIRRCRQVGIAVGGKQTGNEVYDDSYSTNSFLLSYASNSVSEANKLFGLGYMPVGIGGGNMHDAVARNNFVYVVAYAPNQRSNEYGRLSAVVGFRPQVYPGGPGGYDNNLFENNVVVGKAFPGSVGVRGLWVGSDMLQHNMVVRNNTVKVEAMTDDIAAAFNDPGYSFSCIEFQGQDQSTSPPPVLFQNNTLITNLIFIAVGSGYGVGSNGYFYDTTFTKIAHNSTHYLPFRIGYWYWNSYGVKIIDSLPGPGVDLRAPVANVTGDTTVTLSLDFGISSTRTYLANGTPLAKTTVTWTTDGGDHGSFTTDANGAARNEWFTTTNRYVPGDSPGTMRQVQNRTITFTVAGFAPVTKNLADVQKTGAPIEFGSTSPAQVVRLWGQTKLDTALAISRETSTSANVVLATGNNFPDALAGGPLAYQLNAPILLTGNKKTGLETAVMAQIKSLKASTVWILGGPVAVNSKIESQLKSAGFTVKRLWGNTKYDTAVAIANQITNKQTAFVTTGDSFPDALSATPAAARLGAPIVFTPQKGALNAATSKFLAANRPSTVYVLGGTAAVPEGSVTTIRQVTGTVPQRLWGPSKYDTNHAIYIQFASLFAGSGKVALATGSNFPDALTGGPFAARQRAPLFLLDPKGTLLTQTRADILGLKPSTVYVFGGPAALSDAVVKKHIA